MSLHDNKDIQLIEYLNTSLTLHKGDLALLYVKSAESARNWYSNLTGEKRVIIFLVPSE